MYRIFWKTTFATFSIALLMINLSFAFNLINFTNWGVVTPISDFSNKYFGVSTIIQFISDFQIDDINEFNGLKSFMNDVMNHANQNLYGNWQIIFKEFEWSDVFLVIPLILISIFSLFSYTTYAFLYVIYTLCTLGYLMAKITLLFGGAYYNVVPSSPLTLLINFV